MNNKSKVFWFFTNRELCDITKKLEGILELPRYYHDYEDTWEWCESVKRRYYFINELRKYYDDDTLKKMYGENCLEVNKDYYIDEESNDLYFDIYREHNNGLGEYDKPVILVIEKFPQNYTWEEYNSIGCDISIRLKVDVSLGFINWEREKENGIIYNFNPSKIFKVSS